MSAISLIFPFLIKSAFAGSISLPVSEVEKVLIKGTEAQVQLLPGTGPNLNINGIEETNATGAYSVVRKGNIIEVRMNEVSEKGSWTDELRKGLSARTPKLEIVGVSVPVEIQLRHGVVLAQQWNKDVKISMVQGRVQFQKGSAALNAHVQKGAVQVFDHNGRVSIDSYEGQVQVRNIQGDGNIRLFAGLLQGEKMKGFWTLQTQQAQVKLQDVTGTVQFENGKGALNVQSLNGRLEGQTQEGVVTAQLALDAELDVRSKGGRVNVQLAPGSGSALNLKTEDADIFVPNEVKVVRTGAERSVRGRVRGDAQRGRVFVRAQDAAISVK